MKIKTIALCLILCPLTLSAHENEDLDYFGISAHGVGKFGASLNAGVYKHNADCRRSGHEYCLPVPALPDSYYNDTHRDIINRYRAHCEQNVTPIHDDFEWCTERNLQTREMTEEEIQAIEAQQIAESEALKKEAEEIACRVRMTEWQNESIFTFMRSEKPDC